MRPTLFFVHGTGVRDVRGSVEEIRRGVAKVMKWEDPEQVQPILWGTEVGPPDLDISAALPPRYSTRGASGSATGLDPGQPGAAAVWEVLLADPTAELRVVALEDPAEVAIVPGIGSSVAVSGVALQDELRYLRVSDEALAAAGLTAEQLSAAAKAISESGAVGDAADRAGADGQGEMAMVTARAVVAAALRSAAAQPHPNARALYDAGIREALVDDVARAIAPGTRGGVDIAKTFLAGLGTRIATHKRVEIMNPLSDFVRDVAFYLQHGAAIRAFIADYLRRHANGGPVVLLGHSLGGIACVDLLSELQQQAGADSLRVDLLVTVGSQAPWLYLMNALNSLSPTRSGDGAPFQPWLNIYNDEDLLSFCAERVFGEHDGISDEPVDAGVPFPMSHSAYWSVDDVYRCIQDRLPS